MSALFSDPTFDITHAPPALVAYWTKGAGAAKIRWGQPGDFMRCVRAVQAEVSKHGKPMSDRMVKGYCSNLHVVATGGRPGTE